MAFTSSSPAPSKTDDILSVLANPEAATAKLKEIQDATALNELSIDRLTKEAADLELKRNALTLEYAKLEGIKRETKKELEHAQIANTNLATKFKELEVSLKGLEDTRKELADQKRSVSDDKLEFKRESEALRADLEVRRRDIISKERKVDELLRQQNVREAAVAEREQKATSLVNQYNEMITKLREILT